MYMGKTMGNTLEKTTTLAIPLWKTVNGKIEHVPIQQTSNVITTII